MPKPVSPVLFLRALALLLIVLLAASTRSRAQDGEDPAAEDDRKKAKVVNVADKDARDALERFEREFDTEDIDFRLEALGRLRRVIHPDVSERLLDLAFKHADTAIRGAAFRGLAFQKPSAKIIGPRVARVLREEAEVSLKKKRRGDFGLVVNPRTGEVDTESPEGQAALRVKRDRGRMLAEAVRVLYHLDYRDRYSVETLEAFLDDGNDELVALVLELFGIWKEWTVLPEIRDLWEMYPYEDRFETGSVKVDTGSAGTEDQRAARSKWMAKYGDPDKRRPRPKVTQAIKRVVPAITGEEIKEPDELREFLTRSDVKRKIKR